MFQGRPRSKRDRERARQDRAKQKTLKRAEAKERRAQAPVVPRASIPTSPASSRAPRPTPGATTCRTCTRTRKRPTTTLRSGRRRPRGSTRLRKGERDEPARNHPGGAERRRGPTARPTVRPGSRTRPPRRCRHSYRRWPPGSRATCSRRAARPAWPRRSQAAITPSTSTTSSSLQRAETVADGNGILGHIFGSKDVSRQVAARAAQSSGVAPDILAKMLPLVAALAMGSMSRRASAASSSGLGAAQPGGADRHADADARRQPRRLDDGRRRRPARQVHERTLTARGTGPAPDGRPRVSV